MEEEEGGRGGWAAEELGGRGSVKGVGGRGAVGGAGVVEGDGSLEKTWDKLLTDLVEGILLWGGCVAFVTSLM